MTGVSGTDFLAEATDELYGSDPEGFTERRAALAAQARAAGDRPAAKQIAGLRKPTRPAWIINQLVRGDHGVAARLTELGDDLRAAATALDGAKIRELSQGRRRLIDSLIRQALQQAGEQSPSAALREDLTATFGAALADPEVARELAAGTLLRAIHRADFSAGMPELSLVPPVADTADTADTAGTAGTTGTAETLAPGNWAKTRGTGRAKAAGAAPDARAARPAKARGARPAEPEQAAGAAQEARPAGKAAAGKTAADEARARDAARAASAEAARAAKEERAAQEQRRAVAGARQALADATQAADQAAAAERDQRGQVRALEDQLDEARRQLTGARRRVRETQAAQQKAQRALSRLTPAR